MNGPRAHASSAASPSTEVNQAIAAASPAAPPSTEGKQAIAAAPPASSPPGLTRKDCMPSAPPLMTGAAGEKFEKKPQMVCMCLAGAVHRCNEEITRVSSGSSNVGRSSAQSSGSSPNEKASSPQEVTPSMAIYLSELVENLRITWDNRQKAQQEKDKELEMMVIQVERLARECGADQNSPDLWLGVLEIIHSKCATKLFLRADKVGRLAIINHYAKVHRCQDLCGSQPTKFLRKSNLKSDVNTAEDSETEWDEALKTLAENSPVGFNCATSSTELPLFNPSQEKEASSSRLPKRSKKTTD